jgi:plastocyanin
MWRWWVVGLWLAATLASAAELRVTVRDASGQPLPEAVVMLESPQAARAVKPLTGVEMVQRDKTFIPQVLVVTRGTAVSFPNRDTVRHHVYSLSPAKPFEIKLYAGTPANPVVFDRAGVVVLGCNIHDEMVAWIVVADTPYFGVTGPTGVARLTSIPPGKYSMVVWHPDLPVGSSGVRQSVTLRSDAGSLDVTLKEIKR